MILSARIRLVPLLLTLAFILPGCEKVASAISPATPVPQDVIDIIHAVDAGDHSELQSLLEAGAMPTPEGWPLSPIHRAIISFKSGQLSVDSEALELLLAHGADPSFVEPGLRRRTA